MEGSEDMFPDYPAVKRLARRQFLEAVRASIPQHAPLLAGIRHSTVHEGKRALLTRQDHSTDDVQFQKASAELSLSREEMRRSTIDQLLRHVRAMAEQFAEQQERLMFSKIGEAVEAVGNVVSAAEIGAKQAFLETQRKLEVDFDAETLEPKNMVIVLHPSQAEKFMAEAAEWEKDPQFVKEMSEIRNQQIKAWRARENRRKLVD